MAQDKGRARRAIIVTGGSAGIGRAIALRFARAGCHIGLIARDEDALIEAGDAICQHAGVTGDQKVAFAAADVAEPTAVFEAAEALEQQIGPVDIWINNAMETCFSPLAEMTPDEFRRITEVTYLGFVYGTMAALKSMRPRGKGRILQIGSALAYRGIPLQSAYCGAKHAIRGFTDAVRSELMAEDMSIKLTIVDLPAVNTPQFEWARSRLPHEPRPMGTPYEPEVVADAVFKAASGRYREYWLGFPTMATILANAVLPGYLDRYLARHAVTGQQTDEIAVEDRSGNLDHPVLALHRIRGRFSDEAKTNAVMVPGEVGRIGTVVAGGAICFGIGMLIGLGRKRK